jgi:type II secretory pathway pseudopilin PulG
MCPTRRKRSTAGFTLAEVIVSTLIVAFLMIALLTSFIMGRYVTQVAKHRAQATNALRARIEYLKGLGYDAVNAMEPVTVEGDVPIDPVHGGSAVLSGTRTTTIADADGDDVLEVLVEMRWTERHYGQAITVSEQLQTLIAPR